MSQEILSVAVCEPLPGHERDSLETLGLQLKILSSAGSAAIFSTETVPRTFFCVIGNRRKHAGQRMKILRFNAAGRN